MASGLPEMSPLPLASYTCRILLKGILPNTHAATCYTVQWALERWRDTTLGRTIQNLPRI